MFGVDDGNNLYESSFNGLKMKENVVFHISGDVVVLGQLYRSDWWHDRKRI